jgi:uncharacterized protein Yka (UPF0111/DUF47 family)
MEAQTLIEDAATEFAILQEELQDWFDNMPENLQESTKASQLNDAIETLEDVLSSAQEIVETDVEFPGMCG